MSLPKEPRQKMINMMYLVLTALLALNVSSQILEAFKTVDNSLNTATGTIEKKNEEIFKSFEAKLKDPANRAKAEEWQPRALQAKKLADDMITYIDALKLELKQESGLQMKDGKEDYREDNLDAATRLFVEEPPTGKGKGKELLAKLTSYKEGLLAIHPDIKKDLEATLPIDLSMPISKNSEASKSNWEYGYFHMTPTIAAITLLSKFENDVKNSEAQVVEYCHKKVGEVAIQFDTYQPLIGQSAEYLLPGSELRITAGIGAYSSAAQPVVTVNGAPATKQPDGSLMWKTTVNSVGPAQANVVITYKKLDGTTESKTVPVKYTVGSPTGVHISAEKLNVLYVGLDNEISISGGSKGAESIQASASEGSLKKTGPGVYTIDPETIGSGTITITASVDGKTTTKQFKVRNVPPPTPMVAGNAGGKMSANQFKASQGVSSILKDFLYDGVKYTVVGYVFVCTGKGFENGPQYTQVNGAYYNAEANRIKEMCKPGSSVIISDIYVEGPGGRRKLDGTLAFNLTP
ncbi:MAG: gliding motility protein GldM [Bacteroidetes bacterium]|nr:gliding motility protein GldM [Bacteroidota bacterium]MBS1640213.1 gliding motility protein GldM [Bacteroidota bacterium]MBS1641117.1 gliding motility protein GldM [Bacteroidota bacterium]MBS1670787.1 gliding motility protein GldM [Bacteroidota bacterium]